MNATGIAELTGGGRWRKLPWKIRYEWGGNAASQLRKMAVIATHGHCRVEFRGPVRLGPGFRLHIPERGSLIVGAGVEFRRGFVCEIDGDGTVLIGDGSIFTCNVLIQCSTVIEIGTRCVFAQDVLLVDGAHRFGDLDAHVLDQGYDFRPLHIGDGAMVLSKCTVFADVGEGAVIGANSVVSRPIPRSCLAVGAPARPIRHFERLAV